MRIDLDWKAGLVFGIEADKIIVFSEEDDDPPDESDIHEIIWIHLGILSVAIILGV